MTASDEETTSQNGAAAGALDGSASTFWHSKWSGTAVPLPHSITIDMHKTDTVAALKYLPRPSEPNGRIGRFEIHVSPDGTNWGVAVATGTWADNALEKTTAFTPVATRFVRLTAITEAGNRGPWASAAELNLVAEAAPTEPAPPSAPAPAFLPRTGWVATASDQETARGNGNASNVLDGNLTTLWHSQYSPTLVQLPHSIVLDMAATNEVSGFTYTPRSDASRNGTIGGYAIAVSSTGTTWSAPVASGTWADTTEAKTVTFPAVQARYLRLTATTEAGNRGQWSAAAELNVIGRSVPAPAPAPVFLPRTGWVATATDQETARGNGNASNVLDGNLTTLWHSQYSPTLVQLPHSIVLDMAATNEVSGFTYTPRSDASRNGTIGGYAIAVSSNGTTWGAPVASGTWADTTQAKTVTFPAVQARYLRLTATTEAGNRGQWSAAAELNVIGKALPAPAPAPLPRTGWVATASDQETARGNGNASNVLDGNLTTLWHSQYSPLLIRLPHSIVLDMAATNEVSGFTYTPRSDASRNGTIGGYAIAVSSNGTTWGAPVASGTWADTTEAKTVTFTAVQARYIRLTATTEAGNRGQWSAAAELNVIGRVLSTQPPAPSPTESKGSWGATIGFPLVPAAAALLPGNKLLTWSAYSNTNYGRDTGKTQTAILDLNTGVVTPLTVSHTKHDMFCPGVSILPDGRLLIAGGSDSAASTIYNPVDNTWTAADPMNIGRGYQSNVTLSNGDVFTIGGSWSGGPEDKNGEVWSEKAGWRTLADAPVAPILTNDPEGIFRSDNHAWLFAVGDGKVFQAGPSRRMNMYTTNGDGGVQDLGLRADSGDAMNGNAVMYDVGKILTLGGSAGYQNSNATARAYTIDINNGVKVTRTGDLAARRAFANSVVLPDGQVVTFGGQAYAKPFSDATAAMAPEAWNPATGKFTELEPMAAPRTYHSVGLLLPDARVFVGGGGLCGTCTTNHPDGQIFTPPYLLNADGTARPRPSITAAPTTAALGSAISVTTSGPTPTFSLVRTSSVTHSINTDQRRIPLKPTAVNGTTASLAIPSDPGVVIPGQYLLFAIDAQGVPSVAKTITIR